MTKSDVNAGSESENHDNWVDARPFRLPEVDCEAGDARSLPFASAFSPPVQSRARFFGMRKSEKSLSAAAPEIGKAAQHSAQATAPAIACGPRDLWCTTAYGCACGTGGSAAEAGKNPGVANHPEKRYVTPSEAPSPRSKKCEPAAGSPLSHA